MDGNEQTLKKPTTLKSKDNIALVKSKACAICLSRPVDVHHYKSRGAGGGDELTNLIPLCRKHHQEFHNIGVKQWNKKYLEKVQQERLYMSLPNLKE